MENRTLFEHLNAMRIEPEGAALTFTARLADENGWTDDHARRVYAEYRKFLYLAATCGHAVTPSDDVDQAWHLHLGYSRHYWGILCAQILQRPLHHGPTAGGRDEDSRYRHQYRQTLEAYTMAFGALAPSEIWPDEDERFARRFRRIAVGNHWMIPKKAGYALVPLFSLAACTSGEWMAGGLVAGFAVVLGIAAIAASPQPEKKGKDGGGCSVSSCGGSPDSGHGGDSGCGGGCGGGCGS